MFSFLGFSSMISMSLWGFVVGSLFVACGLWLGGFGEGDLEKSSAFVFWALPFVSNLWTSSEISFATSAFTEIESMPCSTKNFTISFLEPACPQIEVSTPCFLHSRITREICFRTAQFISS